MNAAVPGFTDEPAWPEDAIEVARIAGSWGVKGWFKVVPFAADPQAIFSSRRWFIQPPLESGAVPKAGPRPSFPPLLRITEAKSHAGAAVARAQGIDDRGTAEALRGARVFVARSSFPTESADEFYWVDLIGLSVENRKGEALGTVIGLIETGPHSVLRIVPHGAAPSGAAAAPAPSSGAAEILIPFVAAYVDEVSLTQRCIKVDWELDY
jgi:16S rRNA processing protein RimM